MTDDTHKALPDGRPVADDEVPFNMAWGEVELFRWQYGELPKSGDKRAVDLVKALGRGGEMVARGELSTHNVSQGMMAASFMLHYDKEPSND